MKWLALALVLLPFGCAAAPTPADPHGRVSFPRIHSPIIARPWWFMGGNKAFCYAEWGLIMVPPDRLKEFTTAPLPIGDIALLEHEQTHLDRQDAAGREKFALEYLTSAEFRWGEESRGYLVQIRYLQAHGLWPRADDWVPALTDPSYRGMVSNEDAKAWLEAACSGVVTGPAW